MTPRDEPEKSEEGPKTCPCCGGRAALRSEPGPLFSQEHSVTCRGCGLQMLGVSAAHAVSKWNQRVCAPVGADVESGG